MNKIGFILTVFNRPEYLKKCLESLNSSDLSKIDHAIIFDDASTDSKVDDLCLSFIDNKPNWLFVKESSNKGIKNSLLHGVDILFKPCDLVINLDGDAIVSYDFLDKIITAKEKYPELIITGFNCNTLNKDGSIRHKILFREVGINFKKTVGGINICVNREQYHKWMRPSLLTDGNWDHKTCLASAEESLPIGCIDSSVIQHIGFESSMGHSQGGEPPDTAEDFDTDYFGLKANPFLSVEHVFGEKGRWINGRLQLSEVTLICADGFDVDRCLHAADIACRQIDFSSIKILSHIPHSDSRVIKIRPLLSKKDYSQFILKEIVNYVDTPYLMIFQYDGFPINPIAWDEDFLKFDMIGAAWKFRPEKRTANGGYSIRTKSMCEKIRDDDYIQLKNDHIITNFAEDHVLFYIHREYLESVHGIKIAPEEICDKFSIEAWGVPDNKYKGSFGFHGFSIDFNDSDLFYVPYKLPNRQIL